MGAFIARQPNGLLCRFSSVVDCITDYNMTEDEYIEMCAEKAREEARAVSYTHLDVYKRQANGSTDGSTPCLFASVGNNNFCFYRVMRSPDFFSFLRRFRFCLNFLCFFFGFSFCFCAKAGLPLVTAKNNSSNTNNSTGCPTVSYTHLDVYKRQLR